MGRVNAVSLFRYTPKLICSLRSKILEVGFFVKGASFSMPAFSASAFLSVALMASAQSQPARSWFPPRIPPTGEGWGFRFFMKGDGQKTHSRAEKKSI